MLISDTRIFELAVNKGMISPFIPEQVKTLSSGARALSFGTSSYGYDVTLAEEFKMFTNYHGEVIDPKKPSDRNFVDMQLYTVESTGEKFIIMPPHSYVLGHTVEHFIMPRNVTAIAVGKCLAGFTLISDSSSGEIRRMDECMDPMSLYSLDVATGNISAHKTEGLIDNGVLDMVQLQTRTGHCLTATPSHPVRTWKGWTPISDLKEGDRIAVARVDGCFGTDDVSMDEAKLLGYMTADGQCDTAGGSPAFTKYDQAVMEDFRKHASAMGFICSVSSPTCVRLTNKHGRGGAMEKNRATLWLSEMGMNVKSRDKHIPRKIQRATRGALKEYLRALFTCDGSIQIRNQSGRRVGALEYYTTSETLADQLRIILRRFGLFFMLQAGINMFNGRGYSLWILRTTDPDTIRKFSEEIGFLPGSEKDVTMGEWLSLNLHSKHTNTDSLPMAAWSDIDAFLEKHGISYYSLGIKPSRSQSAPKKLFLELARKLQDQEYEALFTDDVIWDRVKSIVPAGRRQAYDFTVPGVHNFTANGIVVHNSTYARAGCIVNVTPIEAGFEGEVVIELSNSTDSHLRVYANEGIAQFLFFESEEPCSVSYADRDGKYQGQTGLTLGKV